MEEKPAKGIDLALRSGSGSKLMIAYGNHADMRSYGPWLARTSKQANEANAPLYVLRDARRGISPGASATRKKLKELTDSGGRVVSMDAEALAALDAMRLLLARAQSEELSRDGETISAQTVRDWLVANLPGELSNLAAQIVGEAPLPQQEQEPLYSLLELLKSRKVVPLEEAAKLCGYSQEQIETYARSHPNLVHLFGGPRPVVCRVVAPASPEQAHV